MGRGPDWVTPTIGGVAELAGFTISTGFAGGIVGKGGTAFTSGFGNAEAVNTGVDVDDPEIAGGFTPADGAGLTGEGFVREVATTFLEVSTAEEDTVAEAETVGFCATGFNRACGWD